MGAFTPEGFEEEDGPSNYFKPKKGKNKIRILAKPIAGKELWFLNNGKKKKLWYRFDKNITLDDYDSAIEYDNGSKTKAFWVTAVWNYELGRIQQWQIKQKTIRTMLTSYADDPDYGSPLNYDINVERTGDGKETEYMVKPYGASPLLEEVTKAMLSAPIDLLKDFEDGEEVVLPDEQVDEDEETASETPGAAVVEEVVLPDEQVAVEDLPF